MDLIQEGPQFRVVKSRPDDNIPKRMTHKADETKQKVFLRQLHQANQVVLKEKRIKPYFCWNQIVSFNVMRDFSHQFIGHLFKCHERVRLKREEQR